MTDSGVAALAAVTPTAATMPKTRAVAATDAKNRRARPPVKWHFRDSAWEKARELLPTPPARLSRVQSPPQPRHRGLLLCCASPNMYIPLLSVS